MIKMEITFEDKKKYPYHTNSPIIGIKIIQSLSSAELLALKGIRNGIPFEELRNKIGTDTNPNWVVAEVSG